MKEMMDELVGERFGHLVVIKIIKDFGFKQPVCKCDCGKEITVRRADLVKGRITSCGCDKPPVEKDLVGQKIGKLTVIDTVKSTTGYSLVCQCECGKKIKTTRSIFKSGKLKSCGCDRKRSYPKGFFVKYFPTTKEMVGKKYRHLIVTEAVDNLSVKCKCECCGKERIYRRYYLLNSNIKACGCLHEIPLGIFTKKYIGKRHGKLEIVDVIDKKNVICKCDCGNVVNITLSSFRQTATSCGCETKAKRLTKQKNSIAPYIGKKFARLTILRASENNKLGKHKKVICKCDCGNITEKILSNVISGKTKSCGCLFNKNINRVKNCK